MNSKKKSARECRGIGRGGSEADKASARRAKRIQRFCAEAEAISEALPEATEEQRADVAERAAWLWMGITRGNHLAY